MATAELVNEREWERDYQTISGEIITLRLDEDFSQVTFWNSDGDQIGNDEDFCFIDESEMEIGTSYLLARMYIEKKGCGLGRAALQFFTESTGATVYARPHDGITRDDGSHLTDDAPSFVLHMQEEGLIMKDDDFEEIYFDESDL